MGGKTGTGDIGFNKDLHHRKVGDYIVPQKRRVNNLEEKYEAPYGVNPNVARVSCCSNMSIYVALVELDSQEPDQVHGQRIGVVAMGTTRGTNRPIVDMESLLRVVAEPVAEDLIAFENMG